MTETTPPYRYIDGDNFCLSARLLPDLNTGGVTDILSITIEGSDEPQSVHVPAGDVSAVAAGIVAAVGQQSAATVPAPAPTDREAVCICGHPMHQHHEDVCLTECGCNDGQEPEGAADLPDRLAAALAARFTELGNPFSEMRRHEQGPDGWPASRPVGPHQVAEVLRELLAAATVPPAPTDRAAILREAEDAIEGIFIEDENPDERSLGFNEGLTQAIDELRRLAAAASGPGRADGETQQDETNGATS